MDLGLLISRPRATRSPGVSKDYFPAYDQGIVSLLLKGSHFYRNICNTVVRQLFASHNCCRHRIALPAIPEYQYSHSPFFNWISVLVFVVRARLKPAVPSWRPRTALAHFLTGSFIPPYPRLQPRIG